MWSSSTIYAEGLPIMVSTLSSITAIFDGISKVVFPSLVALIVSSTLVGHGQMSSASAREVLDAMAQASTLPSINS
jgi:hypothetical protein